MTNIPTPHISAAYGDFAECVLMPGDPLRAKFIAEEFFTSPKLVNAVRGINGYTGLWKGCPVSVMASGMGMPSMGIYSHELFAFYGVERILRVGSAGGMDPKVKVFDLVLGQGACTDSNFFASFGISGSFAPIADFDLLCKAHRIAKEANIPCHVGNLFSSDHFYSGGGDEGAMAWSKMGVLAVEMEAAALYMNAARLGKQALAICTISDHFITGEITTSAQREREFTAMIKVALDTAVS